MPNASFLAVALLLGGTPLAQSTTALAAGTVPRSPTFAATMCLSDHSLKREQAAKLSEALSSLRHQSSPRWRLVLHNDGTDAAHRDRAICSRRDNHTNAGVTLAAGSNLWEQIWALQASGRAETLFLTDPASHGASVKAAKAVAANDDAKGKAAIRVGSDGPVAKAPVPAEQFDPADWRLHLTAAMGVAAATSCSMSYVGALYRSTGAEFVRIARWGSLAVAAIQNSAGALLFRYNRVTVGCSDDPFLVMVLYSDILKLIVCIIFLLATCTRRSKLPRASTLQLIQSVLCEDICTIDMLKLSVPALCYLIQNNLRFVATAHLSAVMVTLIDRTKLLTTALLGVCILGWRLHVHQWIALVAVMVGVVLASDHSEKAIGASAGEARVSSWDAIGLCAAFVVCFLSSFSNVYLEQILKGDSTPLALRNVQMCLYSIPLQLFAVAARGDLANLTGSLCFSSWVLVVELALTGLLVSVVMRFADNNLKNLAQSIATVFTAAAAFPLFGFEASLQFTIGATMVVGASYIFVRPGRDLVAVLGSGDAMNAVITTLRESSESVGPVYDDDKPKLPPKSRAVIAVSNTTTRRELDLRFDSVSWVTIVHPSVLVDPSVHIGDGTVVMAGAVIEPRARVGRHAIIRAGTVIERDCVIGDYCVIGQGAVVGQGVRVDECVSVGAGATIRERLSIAAGSTLGAGATLVRNMEIEGETWVGVPADRLDPWKLKGSAPSMSDESKTAQSTPWVGWVWPKGFDADLMTKFLEQSIRKRHFTNHGPGAKLLEAEAKVRLHVEKHVVLAMASGTAALHAMMAIHVIRGNSTAGGILVSAFGFPPILQCNWKHIVRVTDIDPIHGGPILPREGDHPPCAVCLVNPFGYRVDVEYYRVYCDKHGIQLWMDNASTPLHFMPSGKPLSELADMVAISLHETKTLGRGEGGLLLVPAELESVARRAVNFGYDVTLPPEQRAWHAEASNWRMSDFQAAAILMHWELTMPEILDWMHEHDDEIVDIGPFKRGGKGSVMSCLLEYRQPRPNAEIKYYYQPLASRTEVPECWQLFDAIQARPWHPP